MAIVGLPFAVLAGAISGGITGASTAAMEMSYVSDPISEFLFCMSFGAKMFGAPTGAIIWAIFTVIFVTFIRRRLEKTRKNTASVQDDNITQ